MHVIQQEQLNEQLFIAVISGNIEEVEGLINAGASIHSAGQHGKTPLHHAAQRGYIALVKHLIKRGADISTVDNFGNTPLHLTSYSGYIKDNGVWVNIEETAKSRHKNIAELLLKKGTNINAVDNQIQTPLHIAAEGGHSYLVEVLLKKGAAVNLADNEGNTPLHCVGGLGSIGSSEDERRIVRLLLEAGADINLVNEEEETPLSGYDLEIRRFNAGMKMMIDQIKRLQAAGLPVNPKNEQFMGNLVQYWEEKDKKFLQNLLTGFPNNHKPLIDALPQLGYCGDYISDKIKIFLEKNRARFEVKHGNPKKSLIDFVDFEDNATLHIPTLKLCAAVSEVVKNNTQLSNPNAEQLQAPAQVRN